MVLTVARLRALGEDDDGDAGVDVEGLARVTLGARRREDCLRH